MFRIALSLALLICLSFGVKAAPPEDSTTVSEAEQQAIDSIVASYKYKTGKIEISNGEIVLNVPAGFKFLDAAQSKQLLTDIWGNPPETSEDALGMIFPANTDPFTPNSYAFIVSYDETGFVKDEDADKINYDDMLKQLQEDEVEANAARTKLGYQPIHMVGWAQKPYYDKKRNVLHWAKELKFGDDEVNTLNYDVRVLGRKGVLSLKAIATTTELALVNKNIDQVLHIASFNKDFTYADFNPGVDKIAAVGIGALVAGKVLAKVGFFAVILKFLAPLWKFIALGFVALIGVFRKFFTGRRKKQEETAELATEEEVVAAEEVEATAPSAGAEQEKH
ncbi:DUF2167 domain-containing protein [uncultured Chitinophaga sp.]|uniref:DUF2167 domain-containing protein n=1 Tax=uncultured Chitinophaga sp. TaxID=339340 RepID=UPI0025F853ED|nr:DUF2167 domain-containing protein [uncultured Chitinophaga sp.]